MPHALQMQGPIRIAHVETFRDQSRGQTFSSLAVSANRQNGIFTLRPDVGSARHPRSFQAPGHGFNRVVGKNAERRNDIFGEVFVLVIPPDHHEFRFELIESGADVLEPAEQCIAMFGGFCFPLIGSPLLLHPFRPVFRLFQM